MFALKNLRHTLALLAAAPLLLAACSRTEPKSADIRPVRALLLTAGNVSVNAEFSGEVRPHIESRLGFRVGGKITERKAEVGALVSRGEVLMQLDPGDLKLAQAQALAALRGAETNRDLASAELQRYHNLRVQNFVNQATLDARAAALKAGEANVAAARAAYHGQSNQARYASLVSDIDGVVTAVEAEVGQVVSPGTPVVRVARTDEKEVVIGIPEDKVDSMRKAAAVTVRLWASPNAVIPGKIREISPVADPLTRTYTVKVAIPDRPEVRLGMTALVQFSAPSATMQVRVPLTALRQDPAGSAVWVVENDTVRLVPVQLATAVGNDILLAGGVQPGQTVVTAGVNQLKNGQKVTILGADLSRPGNPELASGGAAK